MTGSGLGSELHRAGQAEVTRVCRGHHAMGAGERSKSPQGVHSMVHWAVRPSGGEGCKAGSLRSQGLCLGLRPPPPHSSMGVSVPMRALAARGRTGSSCALLRPPTIDIRGGGGSGLYQ